jgi:Mrp family chromosome partitioning ATPase
VGNLALAMAECDDLSVCLIDADLRAAGLSSLFGLDDYPGLAEVLMQQQEPGRFMCRTPRSNLWVLPAGRHELDAGQALASTHLPELIAWLKRRHHYVLVDSAPALLFSDAGELAKVCDGVILTVALGSTRKEEADPRAGPAARGGRAGRRHGRHRRGEPAGRRAARVRGRGDLTRCPTSTTTR